MSQNENSFWGGIKEGTIKFWQNFETIFLYVILAISILFILYITAFNKEINPAYGLPILLIFGVIDVFIVLTIAGKVFVKINYGCQNEALGLPSGSVRALIALSLIIIFAIMAVFMFNSLTQTGNTIFLAANQSSYVFPNGTVLTPTVDTTIMLEPSKAQQDFSSQTLTTISTLVVALAGFYFGTQAVSTAKGTEEKVELTIQSTAISSAPSVTLMVQSSAGATIAGIIIKDASGKLMGHFEASNVIPNDGKLVIVTSSSWSAMDSGTIKEGQSYTATITTTKGQQITSASVKATKAPTTNATSN